MSATICARDSCFISSRTHFWPWSSRTSLICLLYKLNQRGKHAVSACQATSFCGFWLRVADHKEQKTPQSYSPKSKSMQISCSLDFLPTSTITQWFPQPHSHDLAALTIELQNLRAHTLQVSLCGEVRASERGKGVPSRELECNEVYVRRTIKPFQPRGVTFCNVRINSGARASEAANSHETIPHGICDRHVA